MPVVLTRAERRRTPRNSCSGGLPPAAGNVLPARKTGALEPSAAGRWRPRSIISLQLARRPVSWSNTVRDDRQPDSAIRRRVIWKGVGVSACGEVSEAMMRGWHANNGAAPGNLKIGLSAPRKASTARPGSKAFLLQVIRGEAASSIRAGVRASYRGAALRSKTHRPCRVAIWPKPR